MILCHKYLKESFKAAIINISYNNNVLNYDVKGVACSDECTDNYHLNLRPPSALQSFIANFSSLFG